jgi:hypothetical protein
MHDGEELTVRYCNMLRKSYELEKSKGLSAVVYTQTTDVETECNGLFTYDREVLKFDAKKMAAVNRGKLPAVKTILPTAREKAQDWRYTFEKPADDWFKPSFDLSGWKTGSSGFGTEGTPGATVRTTWNTSDIWLRREVELPEAKLNNLIMLLHHDEDAEVYINGILAAKAPEYTQDYEEVSLEPAARTTIKPGKNVIAIHCKQTAGGQFIDLGFIELIFD